MSESLEFRAPDHFTAGAVGPPGRRVFYLQAREAGVVLTLRCEKEHVRVLGEYLARLLARLPGGAGTAAGEAPLLEPLEDRWVVGSLGVGYDRAADRIVIEATELTEEGAAGEPATARFAVSRSQAAAFAARAEALMRAGRPACPFCSLPLDPGGHVCPRRNGHLAASA